MPKDISERIIDSPFAPANRGGSVIIGGGSGGGGGGATNLDALTDVTLSGVANGQTLAYNSGSGQWVNAAPAAMTAHALSGSYHTGQLNWDLINFSGSSLGDLATRSHSLLTGIGPDDHHDQAHVLATGTALGADHTISGAAAGEVLRALSATTAAFDVLQHTDLGNILPDQHHTRAHDIITGDGGGPVHSVVGADFTVVGVHPANTLDLLPTSSAPGAAVSILKTDANGGIQLDTNLLYVDGANNWIGVNRTPSGATLDILASANADHTQRIKQKSGQTGRMWRIEDTSGNELIVLDSVGNLQSGRPGFVSGLTGWQITPQGNAEFNNIWARGELHATVFVKDEIHATGGSLLVATAGTLHDDAVISSATVDDDVLVVYSTAAGAGVPLEVVTTSGAFTGTELHVSWIGNFITINDPPSGPGFYFQPGDIVRSKTEVPTGVTDFWLEVNSAVQNSGYSTYSVTKRSGTDGTLPKGAALVSYGREGDGRILMTSDLNYAPYIDVFTVGPNVWTGAAGAIIPRMRMGRLDGIGLPGVSGVEQYGMIAGKDLSDANSGYLIASNLQFSLYKVDIRLNNGVSDTGLWTAAGSFKLGSNIGAAVTTGFQFDQSTGDVIIGNPAGTPANYLRWNQASGTLIVSGSLLVTDPGGTVTLAEVNALDNIVRTDAGLSSTGYAGQARDISIAHSNARRIVGVNGSWDSTATNTLKWGTKAGPGGASTGGTALTANFADGSTRNIADHAGATVSVTSRTYLYVDVTAGGTLTMTPTNNAATVAASPNRVLIAVADPGAKVSVSVVAGSTYISGGNIFTGSIVAANIAAGTITANEISGTTITLGKLAPDVTGAIAQSGTDAQSYGDARRVTGVSGVWNVIDGNTINWTGVSVKFANGSARAITASSGNYSFSLAPPLRWFLFVDMSLGSLSMVSSGSPSTSINALGINDVLIAVVDTYASPGKASINIVAGSTYISGGNIVAQSIRATEIAATTLTLGNMAPDVTGAISGAQTGAQDYGDHYKLQAIRGSITVTGQRSIQWSGITLFYADGARPTVTDGSLSSLSVTSRTYIHWVYGALTFGSTTNLSALSATTALIAVFDPGATSTDPGSLSIVGGATYISGNNIVTGSILAGNIQSGAVTAEKILVNDNIDIKAGGSITGNNKTYGDNIPGFFLGWDTVGPDAYKFHVGTNAAGIQWDGSNLNISTNTAISINSLTTGQMLDMRGPASQTGLLSLPATGILTSSNWFTAPQILAEKLRNTENTFAIEKDRTVASATSVGVKGDICWDVNYLYVCTGTNTWKRIPMFYPVGSPGSYW